MREATLLNSCQPQGTKNGISNDTFRARPIARRLLFHRLGIWLKSERVAPTEMLINQRRVELLTDSKITSLTKMLSLEFYSPIRASFVYKQYFRHGWLATTRVRFPSLCKNHPQSLKTSFVGRRNLKVCTHANFQISWSKFAVEVRHGCDGIYVIWANDLKLKLSHVMNFCGFERFSEAV